MRGDSAFEDLIVLAIALSPLRAVSGDPTLMRAWIEFAACNWLMYYPHGFGGRWASKFILPGVFACLATAARIEAALAAPREDLPRQLAD